jgi:hypothetical protein
MGMVQKVLLPKSIAREELNSLVDKAADIIRTATDYRFTRARVRSLSGLIEYLLRMEMKKDDDG